MLKLFAGIILIAFLFFSAPTCAMGPIYTGPKIAAWEAVAGATGYRVYWRAPGTQEWVDSQRAQTSGTTLDLSSVVPQGSWEICATAIDSVSESGPSNVVPWQYAIIGKPENARVQ